jgi:SNF2 family DNA or RNA helicase
MTKVTPMSGTPIVNRPMELYPLLHLVAPETFNSPSSFASQFTNQDGTARNVAILHKLLTPYMIRRTRKDVFGDSVEPIRIPFTKELSPTARKHYTAVLEGIYRSLRRPEREFNVTSILAELIRCKQICSADNAPTSAELATDAYEETGKKVLIFSQFKESQYAIEQSLGPSCRVINGDVGDDTRYELVDKFQDKNSELKYIVTNILEGLTLTEGHTVIFNDLWWTPKDHNQAEGRAFGRANDPHGGNSYYIQNENTIDEFLVELLAKKLKVFSEVIDGIRDSQEEQTSVVNALIKHIRGSL